MKTTRSIKQDELTADWIIIDAAGVRIGKVATKCAEHLIGKHKVSKTTNMLNGDNVVVINADKVDYHPRKAKGKLYHRHSGYIGGLTTESLEEVMEKKPERVLEKAIKGMLPKNKLGAQMYTRLHVYAGEAHPHDGQKPEKVEVK